MGNSAMGAVKKRDVSLPKGRQVDDKALEEVSNILGDLPLRRDLLIEALHLIQDERGHLSARHLAALAELHRLSQAEVYEVASFYHHFDIVKEDEKAPAPLTIRVCDGLSCEMAGAKQLITDLSETADLDKIRIQSVPCIGRCDAAPACAIGKNAVGMASVPMVLALAETEPDPVIQDYEDLAAYEAAGGYGVLKKILNGDITHDEAIAIMSDSGLRGLGGAGFPAGRKWGFVRSYDGPRLMTVNGDEGEPGTFKDRWWLERQPHRMIEGALIAAHVVGCERIYVYMRDEYAGVLSILQREFDLINASGLAAHAPLELRRGAGAYICGEESAMIESIEGKRGLPRHRPPFIAEIGLFGRPTLNHNVETVSWIPDILGNGPDWFSSKGWSEAHNGLRSYSVSGRVNNPGVKLAPAGIPLDRLIEEYCGGMADGHVFKAFFPGGASGGIFPAAMANLPMDFGSFEPHGGFVGSHAVVILSEQDSIRDAALNTMRFFKHESCGQCTPCRSGTEMMVRLLEDPASDHELYSQLMTVMGDSSICGLGQAASNCVKHLMKYFPEEMA
ncbi:MAG: NAD(P)H-dependent oxidoreductase subunit E [Sneathiella sp.]